MRHRIGRVCVCACVCVYIWSQSKHTIPKQTIDIEFRKLRCMMKDASVAFSQFWYKFVARYLHRRTISNSYIVLSVWLHWMLRNVIAVRFKCIFTSFRMFSASPSLPCLLSTKVFSKEEEKKQHPNIYRLFMFINEMNCINRCIERIQKWKSAAFNGLNQSRTERVCVYPIRANWNAWNVCVWQQIIKTMDREHHLLST